MKWNKTSVNNCPEEGRKVLGLFITDLSPDTLDKYEIMIVSIAVKCLIHQKIDML